MTILQKKITIHKDQTINKDKNEDIIDRLATGKRKVNDILSNENRSTRQITCKLSKDYLYGRLRAHR